jgi:hypothetical protein
MVEIKTLSAGIYDIHESYEAVILLLAEAKTSFVEFKLKQGTVMLNLSNIVSIRRKG